MTLGNIPRLYTALADWIACMLCVSLFPHRLKGWQLRAVQAFFLAVMCVFLAATGNVPVAWFVPCILLSAALMFVFIYLCCDFSPANAGYYCVRAFILAELAASLEWQLYYYAAYSAGGTSLPVGTDDLRPNQLLREPWCRECARRGIHTRATVVDHIQPHRGNWTRFIDRDNLQSLCKSCHDRKTALEMAAEKRQNRGHF